MLPQATFPKVRFETYEAPAIGAAIHGRNLLQMDLLDAAPTTSPAVKALSRDIFISNSSNGAKDETTVKQVLLPRNIPLPALEEVELTLPEGANQASVYFYLGGITAADPVLETLLGGLTVSRDALPTEHGIKLVVKVNENEGLTAEIVTMAIEKTVLQSVHIPFTA